MKKLLSMFILLLTLVSCSQTKKEIKIITPSGAPLLTQIKLIDENKKILDHKLNINVVNGQDPIKAALSKGNYDFVVSPVNLGITLAKKQENFNYKILSVITKGNIFLASTSHIESYNDLADKKIILFGEKTINDLVVKEIFKHYNINQNISYLGNTNLTANQLLANKEENTVYLVAEPSLSQVKNKFNGDIYTLDVSNEFKNITGIDFYQAALFVKNDVDKEFVEEFKVKYNESVEFANKNTEEFSEIAQKYNDYGVPSKEILLLATKNSKLCFETEIKENLNKLNSKFASSFGGESEIDEKFFY